MLRGHYSFENMKVFTSIANYAVHFAQTDADQHAYSYSKPIPNSHDLMKYCFSAIKVHFSADIRYLEEEEQNESGDADGQQPKQRQRLGPFCFVKKKEKDTLDSAIMSMSDRFDVDSVVASRLLKEYESIFGTQTTDELKEKYKTVFEEHMNRRKEQS